MDTNVNQRTRQILEIPLKPYQLYDFGWLVPITGEPRSLAGIDIVPGLSHVHCYTHLLTY